MGKSGTEHLARSAVSPHNNPEETTASHRNKATITSAEQ